jgi:hypothetical protein
LVGLPLDECCVDPADPAVRFVGTLLVVRIASVWWEVEKFGVGPVEGAAVRTVAASAVPGCAMGDGVVSGINDGAGGETLGAPAACALLVLKIGFGFGAVAPKAMTTAVEQTTAPTEM